MSLLNVPAWVKAHLYEERRFDALSAREVMVLRQALQRFSEPNPEVSVVIPAWNEADTIHRTLASLAASNTRLRTELIVIDNNSTDATAQVLETLGVRTFLQTVQGTPHARQMGLDRAKGRFHLCADSDTLYPPGWIDRMVKPMREQTGIVGVYGTYSFIPPPGQNRLGLAFYEFMTLLPILYRKRKKEYMNVYGFNMGFVTEIGRQTGGFRVGGNRVYTHVVGSDFANEAEDGRMALNLTSRGKLYWVMHPKARVFTSSRRLMDEGSIGQAFIKRVKRQLGFSPK
ncbi:glycosyltransferase family 2 protein [Salmonirosea aquatica]|uniref:Glycosyltransferase n=1 Tax=Salmonirosea aquatica TaxID=2654236 RepID=A0A7C9BEN2_9BACT|nr:glycosyltransferase [Cytophagaceae bacterium SJW1-29]